jgi:hypothetical protein
MSSFWRGPYFYPTTHEPRRNASASDMLDRALGPAALGTAGPDKARRTTSTDVSIAQPGLELIGWQSGASRPPSGSAGLLLTADGTCRCG